MTRFSSFLFLFLISTNAFATLSNCQNLYVGRIDHYVNTGVDRFTLVEDPSHANGSNWISINNWQESAKMEIVSTLLSAKMTGEKVLVETTASDGSDHGCKINEAGRKLYRLILQQGEY